MKKMYIFLIIILIVVIGIACFIFNMRSNAKMENIMQSNNNLYNIQIQGNNINGNLGNNVDTLLYQGKASIRIVTREGKVIYIDPFSGNGYDLPADLILVTHEHFDHNDIDKIKNRNTDCRIIRSRDAIINGEHQIFDLGYATVEAVEAGYNSYHDVNECVGYIITLSDGISIYVTGDTSITNQMPSLAEKNIDYAFYCCDGVFNMGLDEAIEAANYVKAKHNIPYHMTARIDDFDRNKAEAFNVDGKMILENGEEITLSKD